MKILLPFLYLVVVASCGTTSSDLGEIQLRVNSYTVDCVGEMEGTCLLIQEGENIGTEDWEYFYYVNSIEGFEYEPGYIYDLIVVKRNIPNPPADGSSYKYELVKIISKKPQ